MSREHIQMVDPGQNLTLPNHSHGRSSFEKHRDLEPKPEPKRADIDEKELNHDVNEKDVKKQHVPHSKASVDME